MKLPRKQESPAGRGEAISEILQADEANHSLAEPVVAVDVPTRLTYAEAVATVAGQPAVFVVTRDVQGRTRRRTFLTLASAHKAVERAFERGATAQMVLVHMTPTVGGEL